MERKEVLEILEDLLKQNPGSKVVENYINKVNSSSDKELNRIIIGFSKEGLREYVINQIEKEKIRNANDTKSNITLNDYFEYGINGRTVHIHLPKDLHNEFEQLGKKKAIAQIGIYLIDAVNKLNESRISEDELLKNCDSLYMMSPIFYSGGFYPRKLRRMNKEISIESPVLMILRRLGLNVRTIKAKELRDREMITEDKEVQLALKNFGNKKDVGIASLDFDKLNTKKWHGRLKRYDRILRKYVKKEMNEKSLEEK